MSRKSERPPRSRKKKTPPRGRPWGALAALVMVAMLVVSSLALFYKRRSGEGRPVDVEVTAGLTDQELVAKLEALGAIDSATLFSLLLKLRGGAQAKPGRHLLSDDLSMVEVLRRLRRSPDVTKVRVTIPEGWNRFQIAKRLRDKRVCDDQAFLAASVDPVLMNELGLGASAEGFLFPWTYELPADGEASEVVRRMVSEARQRIDRLLRNSPGALERLKPLGFGVREVIVLASIVEKEAVVDDERPIIASVFLNRLRDPVPTKGRLEADPTAGYGCLVSSPPPPSCVAWLASGTHKVNAAIQHDPANLWSTYTHPGLPPTPISNPGEKSIAAVLAPANTKYFFFVAKGGGRHTFSETLSAHQAATHPSAPPP